MSLQPGFTLRPAAAADFPAIKALVRNVHINPMGLAWERFLLAVDEHGRMVGCGQVKHHFDGSQELASIAVQPDWRRRGVARTIINRLLSEHSGTIYLTCRPQLEPFYQPFGFRAVMPDEMSPYFRRLVRLVGVFRSTGLLSTGPLVMRKE